MSVRSVTNTTVPTRVDLPRPTTLPVQSWPLKTVPVLEDLVVNNHRHSRTASSSILPEHLAAMHRSPRQPVSHSRNSSDVSAIVQRQPTAGSVASVPRRSTSGRSVVTNSPSSYVALMRKQKATVWCDRSQSIDARALAQQKAAKHRAALEVTGGGSGNGGVGGGGSSARTSTISSGGMVSKIAHRGVPKAGTYIPPNMSGASVPMRLSELDMMGEEDMEGRTLGDNSMVHARSGSGKSSINSGQYRSGYPRPHITPPDGGSPHEDIPEAGETPMPEPAKENYFEEIPSHTPSQLRSQRTDSVDSFGELPDMKAPSTIDRLKTQQERLDDLRRRGSVDERTMSMGAPGRLYVANPDLD